MSKKRHLRRMKRGYSHTTPRWRVTHDAAGRVIAKELVGWSDVTGQNRVIAERGLRADR